MQRGRTALLIASASLIAIFLLLIEGELALKPALLAMAFIVIVSAVLAILRDQNFKQMRAYFSARAKAEDPLLIMDKSVVPQIPESGPYREMVQLVRRGDEKLVEFYRRHASDTQIKDRAFEAISDPFIILDGRRRVVSANKAALDQFGKALISREIVTLTRSPSVLTAIDQAISNSEAGEGTWLIGGAFERVFTVKVTPLDRKDDQAAAVILLFVDVTDRQSHERMRSDFIANVSHELRTPLASLVGFIETLQGPAKDDLDAHVKFLEIMSGQAGRMARLVDDLTSLSRIESKEHSAPTDTVDIETIVRSVKATLELEARRVEVDVRLDFAEDLPSVLGDADEISQVVQNLLENALKYGRSGTEVRVEAQRVDRAPVSFPGNDRQALEIKVTDQGAGIPSEHIPRLTERFYRVDADRSRQIGGTGLGLAIVKHIINRHRGSLLVESTVGQGSTFSVYLPLAGSR